MAIERLGKIVKDVPSLPPLARAAGTYNGSLGGTSGWIDVTGFGGAKVILQFGAVDDALATINLTVYEADDALGNGAVIAGAQTVALSGGGSTAADNLAPAVDIKFGGMAPGRKKFIRPQAIAASTGNFTAGILVQLYEPAERPVVNVPATVFVPAA